MDILKEEGGRGEARRPPSYLSITFLTRRFPIDGVRPPREAAVVNTMDTITRHSRLGSSIIFKDQWSPAPTQVRMENKSGGQVSHPKNKLEDRQEGKKKSAVLLGMVQCVSTAKERILPA